jgi:hypothetical protein
MKDKLRKLLYGDIYEVSPGSGRYDEQNKRIDAAIALMEDEMAKKKKESENEEMKDKPTSFRDKMVKKLEGEKKDDD